MRNDAKPDHVEAALAEAARLTLDDEISLDDFVSAAWSAYVDARPGMRERLEEVQLDRRVAQMRKLGKVAQA